MIYRKEQKIKADFFSLKCFNFFIYRSKKLNYFLLDSAKS